MIITPVGLQLSRAKGFNLEMLSRRTNGLPAINVARPSRDGNHYRVGLGGIETVEQAVAAHKRRLDDLTKMEPALVAAMWRRLRGHNLACWCAVGSLCHREILLERANATQKGN